MQGRKCEPELQVTIATRLKRRPTSIHKQSAKLIKD